MVDACAIQTATQDQAESIMKVINTSFNIRDKEFYRIPNSSRIEKDELIQMIQNKDRYKVYVCINKENGEIVGTTCLDLEECKISMLAVAPNWGKHGIGSKILSYVEESAKFEYSKDEINLIIVNDLREVNLKYFYEKRGYAFIGTGVIQDPNRYLYYGGQKIVEDGLSELTSDMVPVLILKKQL